jgi:hypothetical protein
MSTKKKLYPIYNTCYKRLKPGLYLGLFHGFKNEDARQKADDWGANGPLIGPLRYIHTTYACHIKFEFVDVTDMEKYGFNKGRDSLAIDKNACVVFKDMQYGDWTVFNVTKEDVV